MAKMGRHDALVVGAGVVGIASALRLQMAGLNVLLIDPAPAAKGASYGNAGALAISEVIPLAEPGVWKKLPGWMLDPLGPLAIRWRHFPRLAPWLVRFALASRKSCVEKLSGQLGALLSDATQDFELLAKQAGLTAMWRRHGALAVYGDASSLQGDLPRWEIRRGHGVSYQHLSHEQVREREPLLQSDWLNAVEIPDWSHVDDPYVFAHGLYEHFLKLGGQFLQEEVASIETRQGKLNGVVLKNGTQIASGLVIVAAGVWTKYLAKQCGTNLPVVSERGYHLDLPHAGMPLQKYLLNVPGSFVILPMANGGLRLAGTVELASETAEPDYRRSHILLDRAQAMLGEINTDGMTTWMGNRPSVPDTVPVIGPSSHIEGLYFATGHGHLGLTLAASTARILHDCIVQKKPVPEYLLPDRYSHTRAALSQTVQTLEIRS